MFFGRAGEEGFSLMESKTLTKPIIQKLGLKSNHKAVFLHIPKDVAPALRTRKDIPVSNRLSGECDFLLGFYDSSQELTADLSKIQKNLSKSGMAWVCWQKGNVTDLSRDSIWRLARSAGLARVSSCAIDKNWSALKLMFPKDRRK
jgi:hypothetical protein